MKLASSLMESVPGAVATAFSIRANQVGQHDDLVASLLNTICPHDHELAAQEEHLPPDLLSQ
jgi:hypothetical protein